MSRVYKLGQEVRSEFLKFLNNCFPKIKKKQIIKKNLKILILFLTNILFLISNIKNNDIIVIM